MYRTSSSLSEFEDNNKLLPKKSKIVMLARTDLFAECLTQAISARFQDQDVISLSDADSLLDGDLVDVSLVMLYRVPAAAFPVVIRTIREFHPKAAIGLVVENADELDTSIAGFVDEGLVHGVLPLNLNLDVCLTAIDLLMKGGEHFPAALLRRLAPNALSGGALAVKKDAPGDTIDIERKSDIGKGVLTTREVQILDLICMGTQNKIIADRLGLSENTVKVHVRNIYKKMNVRNRTEAASRYFRSDAELGALRAPSRWRN
ncbi:helix-turn-helix transcriptional regulator [Sinorhizobium saheli]|uniref:Helix-turn-helix transcriptional regulator n=1 Tax=Sinorhizobium saheli TaxID=36856 RepID=A0A178YRK4_SINSA|nr:response regulator transcription factor [Sinorhizobium saheli]MQW88179.1 DNA-binding response regulator [Sinorhizobium saheli]OAP50149.1 helix-turn-helix transcriptional regulator [Sinorhizobium saheli]